MVTDTPAVPHPVSWATVPPGGGPPTAHPGVPLNLNPAWALAGQHQEGHLHLGLIGLWREVGLGEQLGGGADVLLLQALREVLGNLKGADCGGRKGRELQRPRSGPSPTPQDRVLGRYQACTPGGMGKPEPACGQALVGRSQPGATGACVGPALPAQNQHA